MPSSVGSGGWVFFREFVRAPLWTASVVPSSPALAVAMGPPFPRPAVQGCRLVVVELGPGTGAFTQLIGQLAPNRNAAPLRGTEPGDGGAPGPPVPAGRGGHRGGRGPDPDPGGPRGLPGVDLIVSGLPWQSFAGPVGGRLIDTIAGCLRRDGVYTQFTYSWTRWAPPARRQRSALIAAFRHVQVSPNIWRNLPPALVYTCTGPRTAAAAGPARRGPNPSRIRNPTRARTAATGRSPPTAPRTVPGNTDLGE